MPWTEEDFVPGPDEGEAAITTSRPRAETLLGGPPTDANDALLVLPRGDHWIVRYARSSRVIAALSTREQAIARARRLAAEHETPLSIHEHEPPPG